jgi:hypothetical protein
VIEKIKYPGLILSFAVGNAVSLVTKLGLLNLPLGIAVGGIGFGAAIVGGIVHAPKTAPVLPENKVARKPLLRSAVNGIKSFIKFSFDTFKTPEYVVGASAAHGGYNLLFQAAMGISLCLAATALSPALAALAIGGCVALSGVALYSIVGGVDEQFKGIGKFFQDRFNKDVPVDPSQKDLIQKFFARPAMQKLIQRPLVRKFLNTGVVKALRKGPSPKAKKILLTAMAVETSLFSLTAATAVLMSAPTTIPLVIAGVWTMTSSWGLIQAGRNAGLFKYVSNKVTGKKKTAVAGSVQTAPVTLKAAPSLFAKFTAPLRAVFKRNADKKQPNVSSAHLSAMPSSRIYAYR